MQYMFLIYENETAWEALGPEERSASVARHISFAQELKDGGRLIAGDGLQPTSTATTVRRDGHQTLITDGPFAETKEQLGGFYVIEARDLDHALEDAARLSAREGEVIEVRPVMDYS